MPTKVTRARTKQTYETQLATHQARPRFFDVLSVGAAATLSVAADFVIVTSSSGGGTTLPPGTFAPGRSVFIWNASGGLLDINPNATGAQTINGSDATVNVSNKCLAICTIDLSGNNWLISQTSAAGAP